MTVGDDTDGGPFRAEHPRSWSRGRGEGEPTERKRWESWEYMKCLLPRSFEHFFFVSSVHT